MVRDVFKEKNTAILVLIFSIFSSLMILLFGPGFIPLLFLVTFFLYIFVNLKNSMVLAIGVMSMMNIGIMHIGIVDLRVSQLLWTPILFVALLKKSFYSDINKTKLDKRLIIILLILIGSSFLSIIPSGYPLVSLREAMQLIYFVAIFILIIVEVNSIQMLRKIISALLFFSVIFIVFGFLKIILGHSIIPFTEMDGLSSFSFTQTSLKEQYAFTGSALFKRADAFFLGPVATAAYLIPIIILAVSLLFNKEFLTQAVRKSCYFCSVFGSFLLLLTFSRAGVVILPFLLLSLCFLRRRISKQLLIVLICFFLILSFSVSQRARLLEIVSLEEGSTQAHLRFWKQSIAMFLNKPFFGFGAGTFSFQSHLIDVSRYFSSQPVGGLPHNMFLLMAAETGFVGLASLVVFLLIVIKHIWATLQRGGTEYLYNINLGLFLGVIGLILMNLTMNFFKVEIFWILLALGYTTSNIMKKGYEI